MVRLIYIGIIFILCACNSKSDRSKAFVPQSSGNLNNITVVMPSIDWNGFLGQKVRDEIGSVYEGLPIDEPQFSLKHMNPEVFSGFARQSRNILWFQKDSISRFQLAKDQFAKPQIVCLITGEDSDSQGFSLEENSILLQQTILENERKEKTLCGEKYRALKKHFNISVARWNEMCTGHDNTSEAPQPIEAFWKCSVRRVYACAVPSIERLRRWILSVHDQKGLFAGHT